MNEEIAISNSSCQFTDHEIVSKLKGKRILGLFVNQLVLHYTSKENILQYVFVTDEFLHEMNLKYLQHDTYTDIITFGYSPKTSKEITGDIFISIDRVKENALTYQTTFQNGQRRPPPFAPILPTPHVPL